MGAGVAKLDWDDFKTTVIARGIPYQWTITKKVYWITASDGPYSYQCIIRMEDPAVDAAQIDFETNYKDQPLKLYDPRDPALGRSIVSTSAFAVNTDYEVKSTGFNGTATAGQITDLEHAIGLEDRYINGVAIGVDGGVFGDTIDFFVVDKNRVYEDILYPAAYLPEQEVTLKQFGFDWNVFPGQTQQALFNYLARIPAGVFIRLRYKSVGASNVKIGCNLFLHKKVV